MSFSIFYTFFFWIAWISILMVILKVTPFGAELITIIVCAISGMVLYFFIPPIITECLGILRVKKYKKNSVKDEAKSRFLNEQRLKERYRYIKLNKKENIISSDIDKKDKIALLEIMHGCSPESAQQLINQYENKVK